MDFYDELSLEELDLLEDDRLFLPCSQQGKRTLSGVFFSGSSGPSSLVDGSISSTSRTASVHYHPTASQDDFEFPEKLLSTASLEFIGLQPGCAEEIFERWSSRPDPSQNPDELMDYVYAHTSQLKMKSWLELSHEEALTKLEVAQWLQDALLDPQYNAILGTNSLKFWLDDSFRVNFNSIERIQCQLKAYIAVRGKGKKGQKRASVSSVFPTASAQASSSNPVASLAIQAASLSISSGIDHLPQPRINIGMAGPILADHEVYYKTMAVDDTSMHIGGGPFIRADGSINMQAIATWKGGDFNHQNDAWYWTPDLETAEQYKGFALRRGRICEILIIRIQVSKKFTEKLKQAELWYSHNWKEYVWYCKRVNHNLPEKYEKYFKPGPNQTDVMLGHICTGATKAFANIRKEEVQTRMGEHNVLRIGNKESKQWVVMHVDVAERLALEMRGKMHIDIFKPETSR